MADRNEEFSTWNCPHCYGQIDELEEARRTQRDDLPARLTGDILDAVPDDNDMQHILTLAAEDLSRATVPDAATERYEKAEHDRLYWRRRYQSMHKRAKAAEAERDAALAAVERVRVIAERHGVKSWTEEIFAALDGAPEPEWEHALFVADDDGVERITSWAPGEFDEARRAWPGLVFEEKRRIQAPWLPVDGGQS